MDQRDEQEIETRLRAALLARSEQITHQSLRPGVPPNKHTAAASAKVRRWGFDWRTVLVPIAVAAALGGGIFVGVKLPHGGKASTAVGPAAGGAPTPSASQSQPLGNPQPQTSPPPPAKVTFADLQFQLPDWTLTQLTATTACILPPKHAAPDATATLPCGVDALLVKTDATPDTWPVDSAKSADGWWPVTVSDAGQIPCPTSTGGTGSTAMVKTSTLLRTTRATRWPAVPRSTTANGR